MNLFLFNRLSETNWIPTLHWPDELASAGGFSGPFPHHLHYSSSTPFVRLLLLPTTNRSEISVKRRCNTYELAIYLYIKSCLISVKACETLYVPAFGDSALGISTAAGMESEEIPNSLTMGATSRTSLTCYTMSEEGLKLTTTLILAQCRAACSYMYQHFF